MDLVFIREFPAAEVVRNIWQSLLGEIFTPVISSLVRRDSNSVIFGMELQTKMCRVNLQLATCMLIPSVAIVGQDFIARVDVRQMLIMQQVA